MPPRASKRLIDQRLRNRIMEVLDVLASGADGVRVSGFVEYFENFYDLIPHECDGDMPAMETLTSAERALILQVRGELDAACDATPKDLEDEAFIATGLPDSNSAVARAALSKMEARGTFSEETEEPEPSN